MWLKPAERLADIQEYYFSRKLREIAQLRAEGHAIISLGVGSPDLPPAPQVIETLTEKSHDPTLHGYQSYTGLEVLRQSWAAWYARHYQVELNPSDEILPLIGSKEGIVHISMAFLNPGDEVLVPDPGYPTYSAAAKLAGAKVRTYPLSAKKKWEPDLDSLAKEDLSRVKLMWINYPHMPSGAPGSLRLFEELVAFARRQQILLCHDNPYSFIRNNHPRSILSVAGAREVCLELNSLSKALNLAGWRLGALVGRADLVQSVLRFKSNMDSGQFAPAQLAAVTALGLPDDWYRNLNDIYHRRAGLAKKIMDELGCSVDEEAIGMFMWGLVPSGYADGYALSDQLLYQAGVFVTPGGIFGQQGNSYLRISLCANEKMLQEALDRIIKMKMESQG